jgi:hypothetical protein
MFTPQEPVVNAWYTNLAGQLFKVRAISYGHDGFTSVMVNYLDGKRQLISRQEWLCMKLMQHAISRYTKAQQPAN